jgi:D-glycero-D-manno-heptose 1,7-bisphosphate phosphatase
LSRRCVFLDRDGVINVKIEGGYVRKWADFEFLPNIADWIRIFNALDLLVIVVTNQRGISLGLVTEADLQAVHEQMRKHLERQGARIDDIFFCPHAANSCDCRKPKPGLVYQARDKWDIDLSNSLMIGDSDSDAELAAICGMRFLRADGGKLTVPGQQP